MKASLRTKLDQLSARLAELDALLASEEATRNLDRYRLLTRERAEIDPVVARFGEFDEHTFQQAVSLGAIVPRVDGTLGIPNPALLDTADAVMSHGISLSSALRVALQVQDACRDTARTFVDMVRDEVWEPFDEAGRPEAQWPQITATIEQIRPLANEIFVQMLPSAIAIEVERVFGEELREQAQAG